MCSIYDKVVPMKKIITRKVPADTPLLHPHPLLNRIYNARGVTSISELDYDLTRLLPYDSLKGIQPAVECLVQALQEQQRVLIVGDFDADGATSTALAVLTLKSLGLKNISYLIPSRFAFGYGLSPEIVAVAIKQQPPPQLIITVDNGITSIDGVREAKASGIKVLITDHHLPGDELPEADAIINPNQHGDKFLSKNLAGVGVIFYLMIAVRSRLRDIDWFNSQNIPVPNLARFLGLVALGTVADVVNLDHNNRILVAQGLQHIRSGRCCMGIRALLAITKRNLENILASDLGFAVAPRINAVGRLDDMSIGVECLLTEDVERARSIAKQLDALNNERREIEEDMRHQATRILDDLQLQQDLPFGLCIFEETWHQGVLGILASRLKDKLHRPVIAFTAISETEIRGSARSIASVHMRNVLNKISLQNPGLITRFGGHAMAAGLSLDRESYEMFAQVFAEEVEKHVVLTDLDGCVYTDGGLSSEYFSIATAELLRDSGPWGEGFPEPAFFNEFILVNQRLVGQKHLKLTLRLLEADQEVDAICFNVNTNIWPNFRFAKAKIVYRLGVNEYMGRRSLQLVVDELMPHSN
jgi:single-stranded-DNA-specific exonuclease